MNIENMLREYEGIPSKIMQLNKELNDMLANKNQTYNVLQASMVSNMPHGTEVGNPTLRAVEKIIDNYTKHIEYISGEINFYINLKQTLDKALSELTLEEKRVVELRYFDRWKMGRIPREMKYSWKQVTRFKNEALSKISKEIQGCPTMSNKYIV